MFFPQKPDGPDQLFRIGADGIAAGSIVRQRLLQKINSIPLPQPAQHFKFLKARHFRKVGIIANLKDPRSVALKEQCRSCGIQLRPEWMFQCIDADTETVERISKAFSNLKEKPELVVFTDDKVCADSVCALKRYGVLPELLCFRNSYLLPFIGKKMAAFDMHEETSAAALVELLLSRLADPSIPARCRKIEADLIDIS